eukprot:scaffold1869_cov163-Ochromonas_danica.AAC.17
MLGGYQSFQHESSEILSTIQFFTVEHPLTSQLLFLIKACAADLPACNTNHTEIIKLGARLANEHAMLLLHDRAKSLFDDIVFFLPTSAIVSTRLAHMSSVMAFAQGNIAETRKHREIFSVHDLIVLRSWAAQEMILGNDDDAFRLFSTYQRELENRLVTIFQEMDQTNKTWSIVKEEETVGQDQEVAADLFLSLLLSEAQGGVRTLVKLSDLPLIQLKPLLWSKHGRKVDERFLFRLGVGLTKLGLFDLSLRHLSLAATPWESPLYQLRTKLVFSPVHLSIGALTMAVNNFEKQIESILLRPPSRGPMMTAICSSLNEAALVLQALPLLHVVGLASPTRQSPIGHLPVPLPVLLSEVYQRLCPPLLPSPSSIPFVDSMQRSKIRIGVMAGSLDGDAGKIMVGLLSALSEKDRRTVEFIALCFPTARSAVTDKLMSLFQGHVNLVAENKTLSTERVLGKSLDMIIFADAASDARVFAMAHERLAKTQALLWNWGGTLGIPSIDYYFMPSIFWEGVQCVLKEEEYLPQTLFREQVVLLDGLPSFPTTPKLVTEDLWQIMHSRYLLELGNRTHVYFMPISVKYLHPQFDRVLEVILSTDPIAVIVFAVVRTGRDSLPTTHVAVRHDLLHPAMPPAAVAKCMQRLRGRLGDEIQRVRFLPPLEEPIFRALQMQSVAVLDPFPVGLHEPVLDAMLDGVPVLTAPSLQECTNSHAKGIGRSLGIPVFLIDTDSEIEAGDIHHAVLPTTAEDYGVLAVRLSKEYALRLAFTVPSAKKMLPVATTSYVDQIVSFARTIHQS